MRLRASASAFTKSQPGARPFGASTSRLLERPGSRLRPPIPASVHSDSVKYVLQPLRIPRAWTRAEAASLLRLHPMKLWRLIQAGEIRAFKETFFTRPPGSARAFKHERLFVSSRAINDYMARKEAEYQAQVGRRRPRRAIQPP